MNLRLYRLMVPLAALAAAAACSNAVTNPLTPGAAGGGTGTVTTTSTASVAAPRPLQPANGALIRNQDQPVTLVVKNALVTKAGATATYLFEVSTDPSFGTKVQTKDNVVEGTGGQTSVRLDLLPGGTDYYWHVRASGGGTIGVFSPAFKFTVGLPIVINAPVPIAPLNNTQTSQRPALRVTNATRSGPVGPITYKFDVSTTAAFTTLFTSGTKTEGINETGFIPTVDLPLNTPLFWRATAMDAANGITSGSSAVQSFTTLAPSQAEMLAALLGVPLWPGNVPPGATGQATLGSNWDPQVLFYAPTSTFFQSPTIEMVRFFDLFDRGYAPDSAIGWMNTNGYPTSAQWYPPPEKAVLGLQYVYLAARDKVFINGTWDVVLRVE